VTLPFKKIKIFNLLSVFIQKIIFFIVLKVVKPDIIWITYPGLYNYLPQSISGKYNVIYDCMDDALGFNNPPKIKKSLELAEKKLMDDSKIVFASSEHLKQTIIHRGCNSDKTYLVRNGYTGGIIEPEELEIIKNNKFTLTYVGTISDWVDFEIIMDSLNQLPEIEYHFFGPIDCEIPTHDRIFFHGAVKHSELYETIKDYDCLIMPFQVNDLILSVDPVKLYEYINFNKNIITVHYKEIDRFKDFVHFYKNREEYIATIKLLMTNNQLKYHNDQRQEFLVKNTWKERSKEIYKRMVSIL
ncbi:hypothetical protein, partial [Robertmurraya sp. Marseille-Q9965]